MFIKMYISWTSLPWIMGVGANRIAGIQGRYFIPLTLFGCLLLSNAWVKKIRLFPFLDKFSVFASQYLILFFPLLTVVTIFLRFYII
jgi:uncharacterized membrane protein